MLIGSICLVISGFGCNEFEVGEAIKVQNVQDSFQLVDRRIWAFAGFQPTFDGDECLTNWNLLPRKANTAWWEEYDMVKQASRLQNEKFPDYSSALSKTISELSSRLSVAQSPVEIV